MPEVEAAGYEPEAVKAKYLAERDKRLVPGRADIRDLASDRHFAGFRQDPFTPYVDRDPVHDDVDVVIVGGGMAGLLAGAQLRKAGVERIRIVDQAGGVGGTWYWNRYPGVMCDVESYIYLPMLEELGYVPTRRYAFGEEIRLHLQAIADRFDLVDDALFHTGVEHAEWDEASARWRIRTDRGDEVTCRYYVLAVGILNLMKLPAIPGMEDFGGRSFHTARWDYEYTGGGPGRSLTELGDQKVALIGTGASGIQCVAPLADAAEHLYVFQRTPSAIGVRGNRPTEPEFADGLSPSWQQERMDNFQAVMLGRKVDEDLTDDGWTHHYAAVHHPPRRKNMTLEEYLRGGEELDYGIMEEHRRRVDELVADPATAEVLKPYYRYLCKRPCFHDEYLEAFNRPNVTLVDCPAGIERVTERGLVVDGREFEVDCLVYGTGFEAELTPLYRRAGHEIVGRDGVTLAEKWGDGAASLFGMMTRGFPNLFVMPAPGQQAVVTVNYTQLAVLGGEFVGAAVGLLDKAGVQAFDVSAEAEAEWTQKIVDSHVDASQVMSACTPSRINNEGHPEALNPRNGNYGRGLGDYFGYRDVLEGWLERGEFDGLDVDVRTGVLMAGDRRVVVVTGGGAGIGAAVAEELGRTGAFVVTVDPLVTIDGTEQLPPAEETTAGRIVAAGGSARASAISVTDGVAIAALFAELVDEFGRLDAVVNVAGITRPSSFATGTEDDWAGVLSVHLDGYLNVLRGALPIMAAAGSGRILGVTSGSGWRPADTGAYGCAKRPVAALTWQLGRQAPPGVVVNAMSPIAVTRMVTAAMERVRAMSKDRPDRKGGGGVSTTGGLSLGSMPTPDQLGPFGAHLVGDDLSWCTGRIFFAGGPEVALVAEPHLLEIVRTDDVPSLSHALATFAAGAWVPAEAAQASTGGSNPRFGSIFDEAGPGAAPTDVRSCAVVSDRPAVGAAVARALVTRGVVATVVEAGDVPAGFDAAAAALAGAGSDSPLDAVVLALAATAVDGAGAGWEQVLGEHDGIVDGIHADAAWARAVSDRSAADERPIRLVTLTDATTAGGRSRAQAAAQHARSSRGATRERVAAFAVSVEAAETSDLDAVGELAAQLACDPDAPGLSGAELVVGRGWVGLRSHPHPTGSITFGGPAIPDWFDDTLRRIAGVEEAR